jgi:hypothetical protein
LNSIQILNPSVTGVPVARIRTVKPDFFTSDDICALSPLARLLYIGLWCEADREGRLVWQPRTFKRRYLPDDQCDIEAVCKELLARELVRLYGDDYAFIPTFLAHQHVNPREAKSEIPPPDDHASSRVTDASGTRANLDVHAQVGREGKEGKGKEGNALDASRRVSLASELPDDWKPSAEDTAWAAKARPDLKGVLLDEETERFRNHARANARTAFNWGPNWRNWISKAAIASTSPAANGWKKPAADALPSEEPWEQRMSGWREKRFWMPAIWGPPPGESGCRVPPALRGDA